MVNTQKWETLGISLGQVVPLVLPNAEHKDVLVASVAGTEGLSWVLLT